MSNKKIEIEREKDFTIIIFSISQLSFYEDIMHIVLEFGATFSDNFNTKDTQTTV